MCRSRRVQITESDIVHGTRYVLAANHQSVLDSFFLASAVPYKTWRHLGVINYFTLNKFFDRLWLRPFLLILGAFPARKHDRYPYGIEYGLAQMRRGQSLLIYPEGRRTIRGEVPVRHGVEVLAHHPNVMIVPLHIEWRRHGWWRTFKIGVGKPFDGEHLTAQQIMDRVYAVPIE